MSRRIMQRLSRRMADLIGADVNVKTNKGYVEDGKLCYVPEDSRECVSQGYYVGDRHINLGDILGLDFDSNTIHVRFLRVGGRVK